MRSRVLFWVFGIVVVALIAASEMTARGRHPAAGTGSTGSPSLPLMFEAATDAPDTYLARGRGYRMWIAGDQIALSVHDARGSDTVGLAFAHGQMAHAIPERPLGAHVNHLVGPRTSWRRAVPVYGAVRLTGVYPGIDAVFYGSEGNVEYDLVVSPGASPDTIRLTFPGSDTVLPGDGGIDVSVRGRTIRQHPVTAYQTINGRRTNVAARYVASRGEVRFAVGSYDRSRPLILDPSLTYSTYFGGAGIDTVQAIRPGGDSRLIIAGWSEQGDFPVPSIAPHASRAGQTDAYVARFNQDGTVAWLTFIGGSDQDYALGVTEGGDGSIYVTGSTTSSDFPTTATAFHPQTPSNGDKDGFVVRLSGDGTSILDATCIGSAQGWNDPGPRAVSVDRLNRVVVAGETGSPNFPVTIQASRGTTPPGLHNRDGYVARFSADLTTLQWSRLLAGSKWDRATAIAVDQHNSVYVVGSTTSDDFPVLNALEPAKWEVGDQDGAYGHDGFLASIGDDGSLNFSTYLAGSNEDDMTSVAQGQYERVYVGGTTKSPNLAPFAKPSPNGTLSGIVFEIAPNGSSLIGSRYIPASGTTELTSLAIGTDWSVWAAGDTDGAGWQWVDPNPNDTRVQNAPAGDLDMFVQQWGPQLDTLSYSALFGGSLADRATAIASDPLTGDIYFAGESLSNNFPAVNAVQASRVDNSSDGVVAKLGCTITEVQPVPVQPATGGSDATRSTADSWCFIAGTSDAPWLHVTGTSLAQVTFAVDPNPTSTRRTGHITITGRTSVPVTQAAGTGPGGGSAIDEIVLNASDAHDVEGRWRETADSLHGVILTEADQGDPKLTAPLASPANYFEFTFNADANRPYHLWIHGLAQNDSYQNDSVWVQFSDSVDGSGSPIWRTGTTDGTFVSLEPCSGCGEHGWGWRDNQYGGGLGANVMFATAGAHTMRIQQREDGFNIGQATLSAVKYLTAAPGADRNDSTVLQKPSGGPPSTDEIVLWAATSPTVRGTWSPVSDPAAAGGAALHNPDAGVPKLTVPLAGPANYFEMTFNADAGKAYHLWLRMKADGDSYQNDSVWVQFAGSVDATGAPVDRIGSTSGTFVSLEQCSGCGEQGWGWQDNAYGSPGDLGPAIYFQQSGIQTIRIQVREDGLAVDQVVLSAVKYVATSPGSNKNDATVLPKT